LVNSARPEVVHEDDLLALFESRPDFGYVSDVIPKNMDAIKAALGDNVQKRCFCTKKNGSPDVGSEQQRGHRCSGADCQLLQERRREVPGEQVSASSCRESTAGNNY